MEATGKTKGENLGKVREKGINKNTLTKPFNFGIFVSIFVAFLFNREMTNSKIRIRMKSSHDDSKPY